LRQAVKDPDQAGVVLAQRCLRLLEHNSGALSAAVIRLIAQRRPQHAVAVLLEFLPTAEDSGVVEEIRTALCALAFEDGHGEPALVAALEDPLPLRRALAVEALCQPGLDLHPKVRKLLQDPMPSVRLRAALALARAQDAAGISQLISLLTELPLEQARLAEDYLVDLAGEQAPQVALHAEEAARRRCRDAWMTWWSKTEGPGMLDELRTRTLSDATRQKGLALIQRLGDDQFTVREKAAAELRALGIMMIPLLRHVQKEADLEVRQRAERLASILEHDNSLPLSAVTVRLIALRKPTGAAQTILAYLPFADNDAIVTDLQQALNAVAAPQGKPEAAVMQALKDPLPVRRAAAAEALCQARTSEHLDAVPKLLEDPDTAVRLKAALALAGAGQRQAVGVLIRLVQDLRGAQAVEAEDYLRRLSQDHPPPGLPSGEGEARRKRGELWAAWWTANEARVQLVSRYPPPRDERQHGFTLLVLQQANEIIEVGPDGKTHWQLKGLMGPQDAQVVARDRVVVAEHNAQRVTERNLQGEVLWQKQITNGLPLEVQRLRNGNTFIACRNQLLEVDRAGREVYVLNRPQGDVVAARKMRDGQILCVSTRRSVTRLDTEGKELKTFTLPMVMNTGVEILDNGHVIVCISWTNKVIEYDTEGKRVWEATASQAWAACRLPSGNTLNALQEWPPKVIEVDREGRTVGEITATSQVLRMRRR
jgi:HEAT repeat protein